MRAIAFQAVLLLDGPPDERAPQPVVRTIAVREDQTLEQLHEALRLAFGWADPHMYAFWTSGKWWDRESVRYQTPFELEEDDENLRSGRTPVSELDLRKRQKIAYLFDFGDEWRVRLTLRQSEPPDGGPYPRVLQRVGQPPPQYPALDD